MSLPPDMEKKLDGWLLELEFASRSGLGLNTLAELRGILERIRYEQGADANQLLGLKKPRGKQVDYASHRMWRLYLSWMEGMRSLEINWEKRTWPQFYDDLIHAGKQGWLTLKGDGHTFDRSVLDKRLSAFRAEGGSGMFIMDGGLQENEQAAVRHLEKTYGLKLWAADALGVAPERGQWAYLWELEPPEGWYPARLEWEECYKP